MLALLSRFILPVAGVFTVLAIVLFFQRDVSDFRMFYDSGTAWRQGEPVYTAEYQNLNPPSITVALFAPLSFLPYQVAQVVWLLASALALIASLRTVARTLRWVPARTVQTAGLLHLWAWGIWFQGQITWLLLYPCTRAWEHARERRWVHAGLWLAPVIAVKPPFALLALCLPYQCWTTAGLASAAISAVSVLVTGWGAWSDWWRMNEHIHWLSWPENASLWGVISRLQSGQLFGGTVADIPGWSVAMLGSLGVLGWARSVREPQIDRRFSLGVLLTVAMSPLGWTSYLALGLAPFAASWTRYHWIAYGCLCVPLPAIYSTLKGEPWAVRTLGMIYAIAVIAAWIASTHPIGSPGHRVDIVQKERRE